MATQPSFQGGFDSAPCDCDCKVGPYHLTMTASGAVEAAGAFANATIVPLHFEGWAHFCEGRKEITIAFAAAGLTHRRRCPDAGRGTQIDL
jgi:hypothetical protein